MKSVHRWIQALLLVGAVLLAAPAWSHHVLGRPAYQWNEDSSTPPTMEVETQLGKYAVNVMIFPAFPKVGEESRVKLYATHLEARQPYTGPVRFSIRDDVWFGDPREEELGVQEPIDGIHRQVVFFSEEADYIVRAEFTADDEPYVVDLPVRVGAPKPALAPLAAFGVIVAVLVAVGLKRKRRRRRPRAQEPATAE